MKMSFKLLIVVFGLLLAVTLIVFVIYLGSARARAQSNSKGEVAGASIGTCPEMDVNGDMILDLVDLAEFAKHYPSSCMTATSRADSLCKSIDTNEDGEVNLIDLSYFANRYHDVCFL